MHVELNKLTKIKMKKVRLFTLILCLGIIFVGCNNTQKGAAIGTGGGALVGAIIGKMAGNTAVGAALGGAIGAGTGAALKGITYKPTSADEGIKGRLGAMAGGAITGGLAGGFASKSRISNLGSKIGDAGEKAFNNAAIGVGSEKANNALGNIGIHMNDVGNKIKNYFAN